MKRKLTLIALWILSFFTMMYFTGCVHNKGVAVTEMPPPTDYTAYLHDNIVEFIRYPTINNVTYIYNGQYNITSGQPWSGINISESDGSSVINARAGRKGSTGPAQWFRGKASIAMCVSTSIGAWPKDLNFAFDGTLIIDGNSYHLVVGQGNDGVHNNWWIGGAGDGWTGDNLKLVTPDKKYYISEYDMSFNEFYIVPYSK